MFAKLRSLILLKKSLLTNFAQCLLAITSFYGFWQAMQVSDVIHSPQNISLLCFGFLPLIVFIIVSVREAADVSQMWSSESFQFRLAQMQKRLNAQDDFFRSVANCSPSALTIFDQNNHYWFVNECATAELGRAEHELIGQKPAEILGSERGRKVEINLNHVKQEKVTLEVLTQDKDDKDNVRYTQTSYYPISSFGEFPGGVMARDENVTSIVVERERREDMLRQVISTLVAVVDRRDPYASGHSARVGQLARALATELNLPTKEIEAAEIAGSLMNFGKVLVSRSILTKTGGLTPDELQRIRDSIMTSADILSLIDFSAPVIPTLRQVLERFDGAGAPDQLKGDAILMTARIVAVANAMVAQVSPRAYRAGIAFAEAVQNIEREAGKAFDPNVIAALGRVMSLSSETVEWMAPSALN